GGQRLPAEPQPRPYQRPEGSDEPREWRDGRGPKRYPSVCDLLTSAALSELHCEHEVYEDQRDRDGDERRLFGGKAERHERRKAIEPAVPDFVQVSPDADDHAQRPDGDVDVVSEEAPEVKEG